MELNFQHANRNMEERIWSYIDGIAPGDERAVIAKLVENQAEWKAKYQELLEIHNLLQSSELESPSMRFSKNVMEEIAKLHIAPATRTYINKKIIWGIAFFFIALIIGFLGYGFGQMDWTSGQGGAISGKLANIDISKFFNNTWVNAFMMINLVLGLFLLDKYISNKKKQFRKEA